jgi:hypothetical protein
VIAHLALAGMLAPTPDGPGFRIVLHGLPGANVTVRAEPPKGWLAAFCSASICSVGHVHVTIRADGTAAIELRLHDVAHGAHGRTMVTAFGESLVLAM